MDFFQYADYRDALGDWFWRSKEFNSKLSFRFIAKHLGLTAPNHFHLVVSKKRHLSAKTFPKVLKLIKANSKESHFLRMLFRLNTMKAEDAHYVELAEQIAAVQRQNQTTPQSDEYVNILGNAFAWYLKSGAMMFDGKTEEEICALVAKSCLFPATTDDVKIGLQKLLAINMVELIDGRFRFDTSNVTTKWDFDSEQIRQHHRNNFVLANQALSWPIDRRFFSNVTVQCDEEMHAQIIQDIRNLFIRILEESDKKILEPKDCSKLLSLNFALFPYFDFKK